MSLPPNPPQPGHAEGPQEHQAYPELYIKVKNYAPRLGKCLAAEALVLLLLLRDAKLTKFQRAKAYGALAYLFSPIDIIPDFIPLAGNEDDMLVLRLATKSLAKHKTPELEAEVAQILASWFEPADG